MELRNEPQDRLDAVIDEIQGSSQQIPSSAILPHIPAEKHDTSNGDPFLIYCQQACKDEWLLDEETERNEIERMIAAREKWCHALLGIPEVSEALIADIQEIINATQRRLIDASGVNAEDITRTLMKRKEALGAIRRSMSNHTPEASDIVRMIMDEEFELPQWFQRKHRTLMERDDHDELQNLHEEWLAHREALIKSCTKFVIFVAKQYWRKQSGMQHFLDLIEEGNIGLMRGVDKFSLTHHGKLSTYAGWWIRQAIGRYIQITKRTVRVSSYVQEAASKLALFNEKTFNSTGEYPTDLEVIEALEITPETLEAIKRLKQNEVSLNKPIGENDDSGLMDLIEDTHETNQVEAASMSDMRGAIMSFLATLSPSDREIFNLYYGLGIVEVRNDSPTKPIDFQLDKETYNKNLSFSEIGALQSLKGTGINQKHKRVIGELLQNNHPALDLLRHHYLNLHSSILTRADNEKDTFEDLAWIEPHLCMLPIAQFDFNTRQLSDLSTLRIYYIGDLIRRIVANTEWWQIRSPYFKDKCFTALKNIGLEGPSLYGKNVESDEKAPA